MKKTNKDKVIIISLIVAAVMVILACVIATVAPVKRTTKAVKYDLECVAGRSRNPLQECRE